MTNREIEIFSLISKNPMISQKEIAEKLGITRSSVGVQISNLIKKGKIIGKGYIISKEDYIVVIGASNIDISGKSLNKLILSDSNIGSVSMSLGGVARNIAENISRLGLNVRLISAIGDDIYGKKILEESKEAGINMNDIIIDKNESTSIYLSILDSNGDMKLAINHNKVISNINIDYIKKNDELIKNSKCIVLDTNLDENVLDYIFKTYNKPIFVDAVSTSKSKKLINNLDKIYVLKPNKLEAEILSGINIKSKENIDEAIDILHNKGVKNIYLTLGEDGVIFSNGKLKKFYDSFNTDVKNATGAGDAFIAGVVYSYINKDFENSTLYGLAMASMAINSHDTINKNINSEKIKNLVLNNI